jgi:hypothetical protein
MNIAMSLLKAILMNVALLYTTMPNFILLIAALLSVICAESHFAENFFVE